jgi:bacterioferritin
MAKEILIRALNQDCADELQAIIQYMMDHMMGEGFQSAPIVEIFKRHAMAEMKHYETLAERVIYLGGVPATSVAPFKKGGTLKEMIERALRDERKAIKQYREHIELAGKERDPATRHLLEEILLEEEEHAHELENLFERK